MGNEELSLRQKVLEEKKPKIDPTVLFIITK
jgi:hypothetical protein